MRISSLRVKLIRKKYYRLGFERDVNMKNVVSIFIIAVCIVAIGMEYPACAG